MPDFISRRDYYNKRLSQMKLERSSFDPHYKEIAENIKPRRGRFEVTDTNKGTKRHKNIINSHATRAHNIAQAGMFAGVMSPTRPWFELGTPDPELNKFRPVNIWLDQLANSMRSIFNASNLYTMAPPMIGDLLLVATGAMSHMDDNENLARFYTHPFGSYYIAQDDKNIINTFVREYEMTAEQMALEFGLENLSMSVKNAINQNNLGSWFPVVQFIEPNDDFRHNHPFSQFKRFSSVKYEPNHSDVTRPILSARGFDEFPVYVPRWSVTGEDIYGTDCPGMVTLGDVKQLQIEEKRKAQAIDKMVNPPLTGPASVRNVPVNAIPGGLTLYAGDPARNKLEPLYMVNPQIQELKEDIGGVERRIDNAFFVDLFLAITNMEGIQPRNQLELAERNGEKLLQLGPVLQRVEGVDFLDSMISRTFNQMVRAGLVPPAPEEIRSQKLEVKYISTLAQAQRAVDTGSIDRLAQFTGGLVSVGLSDGKVFDGDEAVRTYGSLIGTPAKLLTDQTVVDEQRAAEAQAAEQARQLEAATRGAQAAAAAGQVNLDENNLVSAALEGGEDG